MEQITAHLKSWASILEPKTKAQACETAGMPFIYPHMALMPDAHLGLGATVGSVIPTVGAIMPSAVGVDIGCGMQAVLTQFTRADVESTARNEWPLSWLHQAISRAIPLSPGNANHTMTRSAEQRMLLLEDTAGAHQAETAGSWRTQLGSLGGGNHFIELSYDEADRVWLFLHSGSRGVGNKLAQRHIRVAKDLAVHYHLKVPNPDLAYLVEGWAEFDAYIQALLWAQQYAALNRDEMMDRLVDCTSDWFGTAVQRLQTVRCHHNYTTRETHYGQDVWLSRKGAIDAHEGVAGLIPGSMGAASYVVAGLGNAEALHSAPHGAGRNHSRSAAKRLFTREDLDKRMAGIVWGESDAFLDEHPDAYKPIDVVMADAADLVRVEHTLHQFLNVKGT